MSARASGILLTFSATVVSGSVYLCSSFCNVTDALYVLNTLVVNPGINFRRNRFRYGGCSNEIQIPLLKYVPPNSHHSQFFIAIIYTHVELFEDFLLRVLCLAELFQVDEYPSIDGNFVLVTNTILSQEIENNHVFIA